MSDTPTPAEMIEHIHQFVKAPEFIVAHRSGYPVFGRVIGAYDVKAYTTDEGYTHGIHCPHFIHAFNTYGQGHRVAFGSEETLAYLYQLTLY